MSIPPCWRGWDVPEPKFVVTGTGHHGSAYIAELMWRVNVRCGHEQWFTIPGGERVEDLDGESSWLALNRLDAYECPVVLQVRHPLACIGSLAKYLASEPDDAYAVERQWWVAPTGDPVGDAARCWVEMNAAGAARAGVVWRVESVGVPHVQFLARLAGVSVSVERACDALLATADDVNSHGRQVLSWGDLGAMRDEVWVMARAFGYDS